MVTASPGEAPRGLEIIGGAGGTAAHLEDLDRCTTGLRAAADDLSDAWWALSRIQNRLDEWGRPPLLPDPAATHAAGLARQARAAVDAARSGAHGLLPLADDLRVTADDLASARKQYADAESRASGLWRALGPIVLPGLWHPIEAFGGFGPVEGLDTLREWEKWLRGGDIPGDAVERLVDRIARTSQVVVPGLQMPSDDAVPWLAGKFAEMSRPDALDSEVEALPVIGGRRTGPPPRGVTELVEGLTGLTRPDGGAVVEITRVRRGDDTSGWIVSIPGTQDWGAWSDDPLDLGSNLALMADEPADSTRAVLAVMESAGIGKDDPVAVVGHSQGGLVASQVAATGGYAVGAVLTVGSPAAGRATPATVPTLALENTTDLVPALDGRPPEDDPRRTTVRDAPGEEARRSASRSHSTEEYEELAKRVDAESHGSVRHWRETFDEVLGDGAAATTRAYKLQRRWVAR